MRRFNDLFQEAVSALASFYIQFVYRTSKVTINGPLERLTNTREEPVVIGFWHGQSYCFFPFLKGTPLNIITTKNQRGNYIASMCEDFGYHPIRMPDEFEGGQHVLALRRQINSVNPAHLGIALDGPLGPRHEPKDFAFVMALFTKRPIMHVNFDCKYKITLKKRWDHYYIPLPFNQIIVDLYDPLTITKEDKAEDFQRLKDTFKSYVDDRNSFIMKEG
jgi:lysophospholipid acyltransferase (LPLAT)-like uncharacterized protein